MTNLPVARARRSTPSLGSAPYPISKIALKDEDSLGLPAPTPAPTPAPRRTGGGGGNRKGNPPERRAQHNAIERARRESLNTRFLQLAAALPTMKDARKPSKSNIVNKSLSFVAESLRRETVYRLHISDAESENANLLAQLNELRRSSGLDPIAGRVFPELPVPLKDLRVIDDNEHNHDDDDEEPSGGSDSGEPRLHVSTTIPTAVLPGDVRNGAIAADYAFPAAVQQQQQQSSPVSDRQQQQQHIDAAFLANVGDISAYLENVRRTSAGSNTTASSFYSEDSAYTFPYSNVPSLLSGSSMSNISLNMSYGAPVPGQAPQQPQPQHHQQQQQSTVYPFEQAVDNINVQQASPSTAYLFPEATIMNAPLAFPNFGHGAHSPDDGLSGATSSNGSTIGTPEPIAHPNAFAAGTLSAKAADTTQFSNLPFPFADFTVPAYQSM